MSTRSNVCHPVIVSILLTPALLLVLSDSARGDDIDVPDAIEARIREAGNSEDDTTRLGIVRELERFPGADAKLRADAGRLASFIDRWLGEPSLYRWFNREIHRTVDYDFGIAKESPLYPITSIYRGRMLVWITNEYGNIIGYHEERRRFLDRAVKEFRIARAAFPENRIVRMYLGEPLPTDRIYTAPAGAPVWAALQRENLERLTDIIEWWIDHRLGENGEYGGGWDDDCEMWRHWVPIMISFEHPKVTRAQAFFSNALLGQSYMKGGYTERVYDVEHTAEPSTDTITPMMHLAPDDPAWSKRALRLAELMETLWTGRNQRDRLQFKSTYFSAQKVDPDPIRACDTPYHVRAIEPALLLWQRTANARLGRLFADWADTWVEATARSGRGKPAGIIPAAIRWPDGTVGGPGPDWWDPRHHGEPRLYEWPSAMAGMTDFLLLVHHMTGEEKYLAPIRSMAQARLAWLQNPPEKPPRAGSAMWCGSKLGFLAGTLAKYRSLTGSDEFNTVLSRDYRALMDLSTKSGRRALEGALRKSAEALRVNFPGMTSEVRFTDRVLTFPRLFSGDMMFAEAIPAMSLRPQPHLIHATATGDRGNFNAFPLNAVRWLTPPRDIAALVIRSNRESLEAELFHFGAGFRSLSAELYILEPGRYRCELLDATTRNPVAPEREFTVAGSRSRVEIRLPSRQLCLLRIGPRSS